MSYRDESGQEIEIDPRQMASSPKMGIGGFKTFFFDVLKLVRKCVTFCVFKLHDGFVIHSLKHESVHSVAFRRVILVRCLMVWSG